MFRELLLRAEGVPARFPDGSDGVVEEVVFGPLGSDFWPVALVVATAVGRRRVATATIGRIDVREPRLWASADSAGSLERDDGGRGDRDGDEQRLGRRHRARPVVALRAAVLATALTVHSLVERRGSTR